jgi:hypothetical protein
MTPALRAAAASPATGAGGVGPRTGATFGSVLAGASRPVSSSPHGSVTPTEGRPAPGPKAAARGAGLLAAVDKARLRLDAVLSAARSGRTFSAQELLGLQAETYRTVQTVDLAAKLVEQGAQAVRQTLGMQV